MKKQLLLVFVFLTITFSVFSQDYERSVGIRFGGVPGICYKKFTNDVDAVQMIMTFHRAGVQFTILRQYYQPAFFHVTERLFFHYGWGGHLGFSNLSNEIYTFNNETYRKEEFSAGLGIDGIVGFEFRFIKLPIAISFDYKPYFEMNVPKFFENNQADFSITLMYTF